MDKFEWDDDKIDNELHIDNSSVFALVEELKTNPKKEAKYNRIAAQANKEVARLVLELKVVEAELVDEYMGQQSGSSASLRQEIRKSVVKDKRYKAVSNELREAQETADILNGLVSAWTSRGYQLREIAKLAGHTMSDGPKVYVGDPYKKSDKALKELDKE